MSAFSLPLPPLAGNSVGSSGADSSAFGNLYASFTGMGNPLTEAQKPQNPFDPRKENELLPWAYTENKSREDAYNDPQRLRELMGVYSEFRAKEAAEANKMALQRQALATIGQAGQTIAASILNPQRTAILANIPNLMNQAYQSVPTRVIPRSVSFA